MMLARFGEGYEDIANQIASGASEGGALEPSDPSPQSFTDGIDFVVTQNIAVAASAMVQRAFEDLQKELNRYAAFLGFPALVVDGLLGANTLNATRAVAKKIEELWAGQSWYAHVFLNADAQRGVAGPARVAVGLRKEAADVANTLGLPTARATAAALPKPRKPAGGGLPAGMDLFDPSTWVPVSDAVPGVEAPNNGRWMFWAGGALLAAAVVVGGVTVYKRRKRGGRRSGAMVPA